MDPEPELPFATPESVEAYQALHVLMTPEECMEWVESQKKGRSEK